MALSHYRGYCYVLSVVCGAGGGGGFRWCSVN